MSRDDDQPRRRSSRDDDAPRSRGRDDDRDPPRRAASRDDDDRPSRSRDRDDDRGSRRSSRDDDDRGGRSGFTYQKRDDADVARRAQGSSKFDKYLNPDIALFKPREGTNIIRILPPTWKGARHYGYDCWVHFGVGADRQTYLCLNKMKDAANVYFDKNNMSSCDGSDPVEEEAVSLRRDGYEKEAKEASHKLRVGIYVIDRKDEAKGVQFWLMGEQNDREIVQQSMNKRTGTALAIDDPDDGYDVVFERKGTGQTTKYSGISVDRDPSPLGNDRWLKWAMDHPIPEQLIFYDYAHIKNALGGGGEHKSSRDDRDDDRPSRSSRDDSDRGRTTRDREEELARGSRRAAKDDDKPTWESVHEMSAREMEDLIDAERLDIDPKEAKDDDDLADWICDEMRLKKAEKPARRSVSEDPEDDRAEKLRKMRENRRD
jgi:hypothetical protein